jgi:hypothetical protein
MALAYILIVLPFFVWRYSYYGDLLPNTFYAKTGGGFRAVQRGLTYTGEFVLALGGPLVLLALVPSTKPSAWRSYLLALCGLYTVYVISVGGDHFPGERFFVLLVPWLAVLIANGVARLATYHRFAAYILGAVLVGYGGYAYTRGPEQDVIIAGSDENLTIWRELGWWLADHSPPDSQVAAMSAGAIAYYSEHTTIDMLGLTDRHIGRVVSAEMGEGPAGHEKRDPAYVLNVRAPTYIPAMWEDYFGGADALRGRYTLISATTRTGRTIALWQRIAP